MNIPIPPLSFYLHSFPILVLFIGAIVALLVGIFRANPDSPNLPSFGIAIATCTAITVLLFFPGLSWNNSYLQDAFIADGIAKYGFLVITLGLLATFLMAACTNAGRLLLRPELIALLMLSASGLMLVVSAGEFLTFFVGLEIATIPLYVMVGFQRQQKYAMEAAIKYFLQGGVATALLIMGMAFLYLYTGKLTFHSFAGLYFLRENPFAIIGIILFFSGLAFKLALAPFHMWAPDVYEGANSLLSGYMASLVKAALVLFIIRVLLAGPHDPNGILLKFFAITGILSMTIGSFYGLVQPGIKRILAYSSIANAGYFTLGFISLANNPTSTFALQSLIGYVGIYTVLALGSFGVLAWLEEGAGEDLTRDNIYGLGKRSPGAAFLFTIFLFGLAGVPPLAGFFGKLWLINSAISGGFVGLAIIMVVLSTISLFYYLSLIAYMWFFPPTEASPTQIGYLAPSVKTWLQTTIALIALISLLIGTMGPRWALPKKPSESQTASASTK